MLPILDHYGFKNIYDEESPEYKFASDIIYGDNYFILNI